MLNGLVSASKALKLQQHFEGMQMHHLANSDVFLPLFPLLSTLTLPHFQIPLLTEGRISHFLYHKNVSKYDCLTN